MTRGKRTERTQARARKAKKVDIEEHTLAVAVARAGHIATNAAGLAIGQGRGISHADRVVGDNGSVAELARRAGDGVAIEGTCGGGERQAGGEGEEG